MSQKIEKFRKDSKGHWFAELSGGHSVRVDEIALEVAETMRTECRKSLTEAYEEAGLSGLCAEGRWEVALDSLVNIDSKKIIKSVFESQHSSAEL